MNIAFRVDASARIGTGHFMRCLTLADAFRKRGAQTLFVSRHLPDYLLQMLRDRNHHFARVDRAPSPSYSTELAHADWLGTSQERDAADTIEVLAGMVWDWVIVDHYALNSGWEALVRGTRCKLAVIDDIADRPHSCDLLLDQNSHRDGATRYLGQVPDGCRLLLGPRFALLRDEFRVRRLCMTKRINVVRRVLIFFGGVDVDNHTGHAIEAMFRIADPALQVDVIVGAQHPYIDAIRCRCLQLHFVYHVQTDRMTELLGEADLAIGAGGTVTWERCCLGVPTLALCLADNQKQQLLSAASEGLLYSPEATGDYISLIERHARALIENPPLRQLLSNNGMRAVDGQGVERVIDAMVFSEITLRTAREEDSRKLFEWRNDPLVRMASRDSSLIEWTAHENWIRTVLDSRDRALLIGEMGVSAVGVVRFDMFGDDVEISIYLVPGKRPPGQGRKLLQSAEAWISANRPGVRRIRAEVLAGNERSENLFLGAGYFKESTHYSKRLRRR